MWVCLIWGNRSVCVPPDPSLTSRSLLAALDTVKNAKTVRNYDDYYDMMCDDDNYLEFELDIPYTKIHEMRSRCVEEDTYRGELVHYYLSTHPQASWNHLARRLFLYDKNRALEEVKGKVKADKGRCVVDDT